MGIIQQSGIDYEFRTTIYAGLHSEDDVLEIAGYLNNTGAYALQQVRYGKTLDKELKKVTPLDLPRLKGRINERYPSIAVAIKAET